MTRHFSKGSGKEVHEKYLVSPRKLRNHHLPVRTAMIKKIKANTSEHRKRNNAVAVRKLQGRSSPKIQTQTHQRSQEVPSQAYLQGYQDNYAKDGGFSRSGSIYSLHVNGLGCTLSKTQACTQARATMEKQVEWGI